MTPNDMEAARRRGELRAVDGSGGASNNVYSLKPALQRAALEHAVGIVIQAFDEATSVLLNCDPMFVENRDNLCQEMLDEAAAAYLRRLDPDSPAYDDATAAWEIVREAVYALWMAVV
jgi:hypothetical protein